MTGYFFIADLLGFSKIIENSSDEELETRVAAWVNLVESLAKKSDVPSLQLISDTVFAAAESTEDGLKKLISFGRSLLQEGIAKSFPIRGAISHGSYESGKLTYGKAVIKGHKLEMAQEWIGIGCDNGLPHKGTRWDLGSLVCYPVPMKSGPIQLKPAVAWDVPDFGTLVKSLNRNGLTKDGEQLGWEWAQKVNNTIQFGIYLRLMTRYKKSPAEFGGGLPIQVIELHLFGENRGG